MFAKGDLVFYLCMALLLYGFYLNYRIYNLEQALQASTEHHTTLYHQQGEHHQHPTSGQALRGESTSHAVVSTSPLPAHSPPPRAPPKVNQVQDRGIYGGKVDMAHLGGFTERDNNTISPNLWNFLISEVAVRSVVDVGCGRGYSSKFFLDRGVDILCLEGSHDAVEQTLLPRSKIIQHDFTLGAWWPSRTYDLTWSTEFLEHVGRQYMENYFAVFQRSAIVAVTTSGWGGWHHVEVHAPWWWIARFEARGLRYSAQLTEVFRAQTMFDRSTKQHGSQLAGLMVFINPAVAQLPQHRHLFGGHGCFHDTIDNEEGGVPCKGVDALPSEFDSKLHCRRVRDRSRPDTEPFYTFPWVCNAPQGDSI